MIKLGFVQCRLSLPPGGNDNRLRTRVALDKQHHTNPLAKPKNKRFSDCPPARKKDDEEPAKIF